MKSKDILLTPHSTLDQGHYDLKNKFFNPYFKGSKSLKSFIPFFPHAPKQLKEPTSISYEFPHKATMPTKQYVIYTAWKNPTNNEQRTRKSIVAKTKHNINSGVDLKQESCSLGLSKQGSQLSKQPRIPPSTQLRTKTCT